MTLVSILPELQIYSKRGRERGEGGRGRERIHLAGAWTFQNIFIPQASSTVHSDTARAVGTSITSADQPLWCILTPLTLCLLLIIFLSLTLTLLNVSADQATVVTSTEVAVTNLQNIKAESYKTEV